MKTALLVIIPFHAGDVDQAENLVKWIVELGDCKPHSLLLCADTNVPVERIRAIADLARPTFSHVAGVTFLVPPQSQGWIKGSDFMFLRTCEYVQKHMKNDFLWLEPDAIPLKKKWLQELSKAHSESPLKYTGCIVRQTDQPDLPAAHLIGCSIYPNDAFDTFSKIPEVVQGAQAWDMAGASVVVPSAKDTPLVQSYWGQVDLYPIFVRERAADAPKNHIAYEKFLKPESFLFHRDKEQTLIPLLREDFAKDKKGGKVPPATT